MKSKLEKDGDIKIKGGLIEMIHKTTKAKSWTFFIECDIKGLPLLEMESAKIYETEELTNLAIKDFIMRFPMAYLTEGQSGAIRILKEYEMCKPHPDTKPKPHLAVVR